MGRRSAPHLVLSILLATAGVCLVAGGWMAAGFAVAAHGDPQVRPGEWILLFCTMLFIYGPEVAMALWWITIPVIVVLGLGLAYLGPRLHRARTPSPLAVNLSLVARIVLLGYAGVASMTWTIFLLNAPRP